MMKVGFIGAGNMGYAMIQGILDSGVCTPDELMASDCREDLLDNISKTLGIMTTTENLRVVLFAKVLFLAVKPQYYESVIREIRDAVSEEKIIVTIAPGKTLPWLDEQFGRPLKIVRTMPNTPAMVKEGMTGICPGERVTAEELKLVRSLFGGFSKTEVVSEQLLDVVTAVSGSSPAYVFMFIEAMADAAVAGGMPRAQAYTFAAQAVLGSAKMVLETGRHPGELKDMVCSPAGTTIEAVCVLEQKGFRSAVLDAMNACVRKSQEM